MSGFEILDVYFVSDSVQNKGRLQPHNDTHLFGVNFCMTVRQAAGIGPDKWRLGLGVEF